MLAVLAVLFFLSGASALIYQVVWLRMLSLVFGVTVYAASTVLASFMAGLAIGSAVAGRVADRVASPLRWFGVAEILIAATALLSPLALDVVRDAYIALGPGPGRMTSTVTVARLLLSALVLLPPTMLMGATLPLVLRSSFVDAAGIGTRVSLLYGVNTAGAIAGALAAGFVLIGAIGMTGAFRVAASLNVIAGVTAVLLSIRGTVPLKRATAPLFAAGTTKEDSPPYLLLTVFALSGLTSLALEVVWFRTLVLYYPATTYAFTAMLAMVLAGIATGSLLALPLLHRGKPTLLVFGALHALTGIATVVGSIALGRFYEPASGSFGVLTGAAMTILPAAIFMGIAFPVGCRLVVRSTDHAGRRIGVVYSINLAGAIVGSLVAGFLLLPRWGAADSLIALAVLSTSTGVIILANAFLRGSRAAIVVAAAAVIALVTALDRVPDPFSAGLMRRYRESGRIFMRDEGVQTTVSVHMREMGGRLLYVDGLHQASDGRDVVTLHRQIGHLPMLIHPSPRRVLVIGLGGGATAGAVSLHPGTTVDIVELASGVVRAAEWFTHVNEDVLRKPHVHLKVDDGRNYMLLTRERYDVITADVIQPTHAGAGLLYSQEYFQTARSVLADGGVMVQWVGPRSDTYYRLIARTFQSVFPETTVWVNGSLLLGSVTRVTPDAASLARRFPDPALREALATAGFPDGPTLRRNYTAGPDVLRAFLGPGPVLTDDKPMLEYYLSLEGVDRPVDLDGLRRRAHE